MSERDGARTIGRSGEKAGQKTRDTFPLRQSKETSQFPTVDEARLRKREQSSSAAMQCGVISSGNRAPRQDSRRSPRPRWNSQATCSAWPNNARRTLTVRALNNYGEAFEELGTSELRREAETVSSKSCHAMTAERSKFNSAHTSNGVPLGKWGHWSSRPWPNVILIPSNVGGCWLYIYSLSHEVDSQIGTTSPEKLISRESEVAK